MGAKVVGIGCPFLSFALSSCFFHVVLRGAELGPDLSSDSFDAFTITPFCSGSDAGTQLA